MASDVHLTSQVAQRVKNPSSMQETWLPILGGEDPSGGGHGNPLQHSCLGNPMDREAWWVTEAWWVMKSWTPPPTHTESCPPGMDVKIISDLQISAPVSI